MKDIIDCTFCKDSSEPWTTEEDRNLFELYNGDMLNIIQIHKKINRAPGSIISRLVKLQIIPNRAMARGYLNYKNTDYYKSVVENSKAIKKTEKKEKNEDKFKISTTVDKFLVCINEENYIELHNDVNDMKKEIYELKSQIKELVEMMKAVYEFEEV